MIAIISYGTDYVDNPVSDGVDKLMYCSKCRKSTTFSEYYGQKHSYLFGISLGAIGSKKNYLKCTKCKKIIFTDNQEIDKLRERKRKLKKILGNTVIKNDNIFYSKDWYKVKIVSLHSSAYFDLLLNGSYLYVIEIPKYLTSRKKREHYRLNWIDKNNQLTSRFYNRDVYLQISINEFESSISNKEGVLLIIYDGIKIKLKNGIKELEEFFKQINNSIENDKICRPMMEQAYSLGKLGNEEESVVAFNEVLKINSENSFALQGKAFSLSLLNKEEDAVKLYNEILEMNPKNEVVRQFINSYLEE